jgi:hypothetical protein
MGSDYIGPREEVTSEGLEGVGHAADVEGVQFSPMRFAVAYASTSSYVNVRGQLRLQRDMAG